MSAEDDIKDAVELGVPAKTGSPGWFPQTATTHDGIDAAQSGSIDHSESTEFEIPATGPVKMTFWWKVSSEAGLPAAQTDAIG